jgi:predicted RNA-binding Zn ribbon-like protein
VPQQIGQAPGDLAVLQSFVNTLDIEQGTEELADPEALQAWLDRAGLNGSPAGSLAAGGQRAAAADLAEAIGLREALRGVLRSHVGAGHAGPPSSAAGPAEGVAEDVAELRRILARFPARLDAGDDGQIRTVAAGSGARAALARMLLIAAEAATRGTWSRLKVCSAADCQWAFYDRSPTRNGCWCSMQVCGSRAKSRAYRSRAAAARE